MYLTNSGAAKQGQPVTFGTELPTGHYLNVQIDPKQQRTIKLLTIE